MGRKKSALKPVKKSEEFEITKTIEVRNFTSDLVVKGKFNSINWNWKITTSLTTTQVDPSNPAITTGSIQQIGLMMEEAVVELTRMRNEAIKAGTVVDSITFPEDEDEA